MFVEHMLSTSDNPFNPFTDYDEWEAWDIRAGYHTNVLVARVVVYPYDASDLDQSLAIEYGLQDIMAELGEITNLNGDPMYVLVSPPEDEPATT